MKCFRNNLREQNPDKVEFEEFSLKHFNNSLKSFYVGAKQTDGNHFKISALQTYNSLENCCCVNFSDIVNCYYCWNIHLKNTLSWFINEGRNVGLMAIFLIGQIVFSWILILNLFIVVDVVFKCLRQCSNGLNICLPAVFYMCVFSWFHSV